MHKHLPEKILNYSFPSYFTFCVCPNVKICDLEKNNNKKNYEYLTYQVIPRESHREYHIKVPEEQGIINVLEDQGTEKKLPLNKNIPLFSWRWKKLCNQRTMEEGYL